MYCEGNQNIGNLLYQAGHFPFLALVPVLQLDCLSLIFTNTFSTKLIRYQCRVLVPSVKCSTTQVMISERYGLRQ